MTNPVPPASTTAPLPDAASTPGWPAASHPQPRAANLSSDEAGQQRPGPRTMTDARSLIERSEQSLDSVNKACNAYRGTVTRAVNQLHALMAVWYASCTRN